MSKQQREKFPATVTSEKPHQQQPFIQIEEELTKAQLEAIAGGQLILN